jgi:hypothetical protein
MTLPGSRLGSPHGCARSSALNGSLPSGLSWRNTCRPPAGWCRGGRESLQPPVRWGAPHLAPLAYTGSIPSASAGAAPLAYTGSIPSASTGALDYRAVVAARPTDWCAAQANGAGACSAWRRWLCRCSRGGRCFRRARVDWSTGRGRSSPRSVLAEMREHTVGAARLGSVRSV